MSLLRALPRRPLAAAWGRTFCAALPRRAAPTPTPTPTPTASAKDTPEAAAADAPQIKSSCPEGTILEGVQWLKGAPPIQALPDEAYPAWLWTITAPKVLEDDGPGGKAEKVRLRKINRQRIREQNFMKSQ